MVSQGITCPVDSLVSSGHPPSPNGDVRSFDILILIFRLELWISGWPLERWYTSEKNSSYIRFWVDFPQLPLPRCHLPGVCFPAISISLSTWDVCHPVPRGPIYLRSHPLYPSLYVPQIP